MVVLDGGPGCFGVSVEHNIDGFNVSSVVECFGGWTFVRGYFEDEIECSILNAL